MRNIKIWNIQEFWQGVIAGFISAIIIFSVITAFYLMNKRNGEVIEYAEKLQEVETLRGSVSNRDPVEFLEVPDVRRAVDGAAADFERKRDEALQRFRSRLAD
jgi:hypothetical protein